MRTFGILEWECYISNFLQWAHYLKQRFNHLSAIIMEKENMVLEKCIKHTCIVVRTVQLQTPKKNHNSIESERTHAEIVVSHCCVSSCYVDKRHFQFLS